MSVDKPVTEKRLIEILNKQFAVQEKRIAGKLKAQDERLEKRLNTQSVKIVAEITEVIKDVINTADKNHREVIERLDDIELDYVKRKEFEALKRQLERLQTH